MAAPCAPNHVPGMGMGSRQRTLKHCKASPTLPPSLLAQNICTYASLSALIQRQQDNEPTHQRTNAPHLHVPISPQRNPFVMNDDISSLFPLLK